MVIEIDVPDGVSGNYAIETFTVEKDELHQVLSFASSGRGVPQGIYKRLMRNNTLVMSNTPDEIRDFSRFLRKAEGHILINGLGMGTLVKALLEKDEVTKITIIEISEDVIKLSAETYLKDSRVEIILADCFEYQPPKGIKYDAVWHDIWDDITGDNLGEMKTLHRKYGRRTKYQESWCRDRCQRQEDHWNKYN